MYKADATEKNSRSGSQREQSGWHPSSRLIWRAEETETHFEQPRNSYCRFRKSFDAAEAPVKATIKIFADSRYALYINGVYAARGPCRSDPRMQYYDELDVTERIASGRNSIAVQALHYGYNTGHYVHRIPALCAELTLTYSDGEERTIASDTSWLCAEAGSYARNAPRINGCQGAAEVHDGRKETADWMNADYDDSGWEPVRARDPKYSPFWNWVPRPIPMLEEGEAEAVGIVNTGTVKGERPHRLERLHIQLLEEEACRVLDDTVSLAGPGMPHPAPPGEAAMLTFDMGSIKAGYLQIEITASEGVVLDALYAEELWEGKALLNLNNNRSFDRFILHNGLNTLETAFNWRAFRYVQFIVRNAKEPVAFHRVGLRTRQYPLLRRARFDSSDEQLQAVWNISERTLRLCMQDGFLDSSSREQQQWMGDGRIQAVINGYYSGDYRLHRKLLQQIGQSQDWMGMTKARYPDGHDNYPPIPSFCLAWVCSFHDYVQMTGDIALVEQWWPNLTRAMSFFDSYENADRLLEHVPYWMFIDWSEAEDGPIMDDQRGGIVTALNLQFLEAINCMGGFAGRLGLAAERRRYSAKARALERSIKRLLWNKERGAYADCLVDGALSANVSEPVNALAVLHLHKPGDYRCAQIRAAVFGSAAAGRVSMGSPFSMLTILRALVKLKATDRALELIRERYGRMLRAGSTTTWERWNLTHPLPSGGVRFSSASHAWGAAPIVFMLEGLLGLQMLEPGLSKFSLDPCLCGASAVAISIPAADGMLRIEAEQLPEGDVALTLDVPEGSAGVAGGRWYGPGAHRIVLQASEDGCRSGSQQKTNETKR